MNYPLVIAFLFYLGAIYGWILEFFYRNLISHSGPRGKFFINPGFCKGPWLPIYGIGLSLMFVISYEFSTRFNLTGIVGDIIVILVIALTMITIEFVGGLFLLKVLNMRLWDYREEKGNIMGLICPLYSFFWTLIGAVYYFLIHDRAIGEIVWLSKNLSFSFFVGLFFGLFIVDLISSAKDAAAFKKYGDEKGVIIKIEELKTYLVKKEKELSGKQKSFFVQAKNKYQLISETLDEAKEILENKKEEFVETIDETKEKIENKKEQIIDSIDNAKEKIENKTEEIIDGIEKRINGKD